MSLSEAMTVLGDFGLGAGGGGGGGVQESSNKGDLAGGSGLSDANDVEMMGSPEDTGNNSEIRGVFMVMVSLVPSRVLHVLY